MTIFLILSTLVFYVVKKAVLTASVTSSSAKQTVSVSVNLDYLSFDIKHAGFGINNSTTEKLVISYCSGSGSSSNPACQLASDLDAIRNKLLLLHETTNITDTTSSSSDPDFGFGFVVTDAYGKVVYEEPPADDKHNYARATCVWLNSTKQYVGKSGCESPPGGLLVGFPIDTDTACQSPSDPLCCSNQPCTGIAWFLGNISGVTACIPGTYTLYRYTKSGKLPVVNCVSDWDIWFGLDTNGDGQVDKWVNEIPNSLIASNLQLKQYLVTVNVYLLVQASSAPDPKYDYCVFGGDCTSDKTRILADTLSDGTRVYLYTPQEDNPNWVHYRWAVIKQTYYSFPDIP